MRKSDRIRLQHMLDAAREAMSFVQRKSREHLERDRLLVLALVKAIEIIGEAAYQISPQTRSRTPEIPWEDIIGMRHRLHAYFDIDLDILWSTVQKDLPQLTAILESVLKKGEA